MLQKFIKNIQAKPEPLRKSITLGVSLGITGIVGFFWLISFLNYSSEVLLAKPKTESPTSFLNKMGLLIGESYANVRVKIGEDDGLVKSVLNDGTTTPVIVIESVDGLSTMEKSIGGDDLTLVIKSTTTSSMSYSTGSTSIESSNPSQNSKSLSEILNTKK